jgi:hypothetical protein
VRGRAAGDHKGSRRRSLFVKKQPYLRQTRVLVCRGNQALGKLAGSGIIFKKADLAIQMDCWVCASYNEPQFVKPLAAE